MSWYMILFYIICYLFIGALIDYALSGNPGEDIWIPMLLWPIMLVFIGLMLIFYVITYTAEQTVIFINKILRGEEGN